MSFFRYKTELNVQLFLVTALLLSGFTRCVKEPVAKNTPFVRLLENESIKSSLLKRSINYAVLLPENYNTSSDSFPVVYLLHGYGDDQSAWYKYGLIKYYSDINASENVPMIFVMPQGFNTYFVNRYNGSFPYMDFFTSELVPAIDSIYRTKKDKTQRAVMGYSMGGYGALVIPAKNPELFTISVPLSMSFRTDEQYLSEPSGTFNFQWGSIFGGLGSEGTLRLTDYFKESSPFYFFKEGDLSRFDQLKIFIDCGDDEESLLITNNTLHCLMKDNGIRHEFRISNGGHSWEYWHKALQETLHFISLSFQGMEFPENPDVIDVGGAVPSENIKTIVLTETETSILIPPGYDSIVGNYPVIYMVHDINAGNGENEIAAIFSLFYNSMASSKLTKSLVIEIPSDLILKTGIKIQDIIKQADGAYRTRKDSFGRMLIGNGEAGGIAASIAMTDTGYFSSCCLYNATISSGIIAGREEIFYYLDGGDEIKAYWAYFNLYHDLNSRGMNYEYRVRQGDDSFLSFLTGLSDSFTVLRKRLTTTI